MAGNKFWGGSSASSDSDSDASSDEAPAVPAAQQSKSQYKARWAEESSSEEEDTRKRVVKSHTDKRYDQLRDCIKQMKNHLKIDDFANLIVDYEALFKTLDKLKTLVDADGGPPNAFIRAVAGLESYAEKYHADQQESGTKLPQNKQRAFNTLRAKVRKGNKAHQERIEKFKEHPDEFESEGDDGKNDDDSGSDTDDEQASGSDSSSSSGSDSDSDSDSDSSSSGSSDTSDSSDSSDSSSSGSDSSSSEGKSWQTESDDSDDEGGDEDAAREKKMLRWLITDEKSAALKLEKEKIQKEKTKTPKENKPSRERDKQRGGDDGSRKEKRAADEPDEYTPEELMKKVLEVAQARGRKGFDKSTYIEKLLHLMPHAVKQGPCSQLYIYTSMVSADFDNTGGAFAPMRIELWNVAFERVMKMLPVLVAAQEDAGDAEDDSEDPRSYKKLQELFVAFVEKLDDELYKALQFTTDVYGPEYQEILGNYSKFLVLLRRVIKFFEQTEQAHPLGTLALRLIEQLHYKPDMLNAHVFGAIQHTVPEGEKGDWVWPEDSQKFMAKLVRNVFATNRTELVRRASFCHVYHLALHDRFQAARDLLHLGNLTEQAEQCGDVHTQILNNRAIAQIGLCAFRLGKIQEAHQCLMVVCMHNKARELLAQGLSYAKHLDRTADQERAERLRQLPYHMHINLEVLESAHHICAMLLEVPHMAMQTIDPTSKHRIISRVLRRALEHHDKQLFIGPPENAKEAAVSAAKSLQRGDWHGACAALEDLKLWEQIDPGNADAGKKVKDMIKRSIKIEALRTYLFAYASIYDAFHMDQLVGMFDLEAKVVHSVVSKMMIKEEITAFWDESSKYVLMQHSEPTLLQRLALTLADRGSQAVDNNERLVDQKGNSTKQQGLPQQGRFDQGAGGDRRRFGKGGVGGSGFRDDRNQKGKGRGKSMGGGARPPQNRGWENARAGALRGAPQRGWSTARQQ